MLLRLSRASFWLAAVAAALALLAPGGHESALFGVVVAACALAYGTWRSALRTEQRRPVAAQLPTAIAPLAGSALHDAGLTLVDRARAAGSFEAALHAVARLLRSELGAHEVAVHEVGAIDSSHVTLSGLIDAQPGFRTVARRVRLDTMPLGRAVAGRREAGVPPGAVAVPVLCADRVVAVLELVGIDLPVEPDALAALLEQARLILSELAPSGLGMASGPWRAKLSFIEDNAAMPAPPMPAPAADDTGLDPSALARLAELDPTGANKLLERVLQAFQTSAARLRPQLQAARGSGDRAAIRLVAHTLKSSSASIGALQLSQLCAGVETAIRLDNGANLDADLDALDAALDAALGSIARLLEQKA